MTKIDMAGNRMTVPMHCNVCRVEVEAVLIDDLVFESDYEACLECPQCLTTFRITMVAVEE